MATNSKGRIYGLGSIQYLNVDPNEAASASLLRNLDIDTRITKMEDNVEVMKGAMDVLLRLNGIDPVTLEPTGHACSFACQGSFICWKSFSLV
ncbi:hypothetical protein ARALYDRAFT_893861 [Arabidopsis lyrata subsp. lyrata]|uniref:Uncharacterized protein n=1 Tax=Arabidopsis lyrata subsp. lyrata TaxID=81972 RepID=D7KZ59_ARALL|nr:hypothetical protein ARALYDRAFT_893861 [Arabidopsis lyrata subsp. lyrata]